jgi:hypothetical protein
VSLFSRYSRQTYTIEMPPEDSYKLTDEQISSFMRYGYLRLTQCLTPEKAAAWTNDVWTCLGYSPTDKAT